MDANPGGRHGRPAPAARPGVLLDEPTGPSTQFIIGRVLRAPGPEDHRRDAQRVVAVPRPLTPDALLRQQTPGQVDIVGDTVVYTLRRVRSGRDVTEIWTVPYPGGSPRLLATGTCPRLDPSGTRLAFLASIDDAPAQVHLIEVADGAELDAAAAPRPVTDFPRGVSDLVWAADGTALIVLAEDDTSDQVVRAATLQADATPTAITLGRIDYRADGDGDAGLRLYPRHLHRIPLDRIPLGAGPPQRLTSGTFSAARPRVARDGAVYYLADPWPDADLAPSTQVYRVGDGRPVTALPGGVTRFHLAPGDGAGSDSILVLGRPSATPLESEFPRWYRGRLDGALPVGLEIYDAPLGDGSAMVGLLGDETDLHDWNADLDDCATVTTVSRDGSTLPVAAADGRMLADGPASCGAVAADGRRIVAVLATPESPGPDLYALDGPAPRRLTHHGTWLTDHGLPVLRRVEAPGPAGPITVFLVEPPDGQSVRGTVLDLHGGPTGQWGAVPPVEALLLASAGFRVALPNIRGSVDRGPDWVHGLYGAWGEADVADVLAVADHLVATGLAAEGRIGVMGLSYGGFLTQYLIGVTDRFAAAVAENGVANQLTAWALSDVGLAYNPATGLADPRAADGADRLWQVSPLRRAADITTPLLMMQGGDDRTCPAADNEQLFTLLRALGKPVSYVLYPQESHLMQATARIDRRVDRQQRVLNHFTTHLADQRSIT